MRVPRIVISTIITGITLIFLLDHTCVHVLPAGFGSAVDRSRPFLVVLEHVEGLRDLLEARTVATLLVRVYLQASSPVGLVDVGVAVVPPPVEAK